MLGTYGAGVRLRPMLADDELATTKNRAVPRSHRFEIIALASPQLPMRVLGLLAQQKLLPTMFELRRTDFGIMIKLEQGGLDEDRATLLLAKMETMVEVQKHASSK